MSTPSKDQKLAADDRWQELWKEAPRVRRERLDVAEQVGLVALARREALLRAARGHLRPEDLEDCWAQATLELIKLAKAGGSYESNQHLANVVDKRFRSRVMDRQRARKRRSPEQMALEEALVLGSPEAGGIEVADVRAEPERVVIARERLERVLTVAHRLTPEQRLALAYQVALRMKRAQFCSRFGWSIEKYNSVIKRGRVQLRLLVDEDPDILRGGAAKKN